MPDTPPDRLSSDPRSPFHDAAAMERGVGVRFNGEEKTNVEEYCVSEGWVRLPFGKALDRLGVEHALFRRWSTPKAESRAGDASPWNEGEDDT